MRPTKEDRAALALLLDDELLSERTAELCESLNEWVGEWTPRQGEAFDRIVETHL